MWEPIDRLNRSWVLKWNVSQYLLPPFEFDRWCNWPEPKTSEHHVLSKFIQSEGRRDSSDKHDRFVEMVVNKSIGNSINLTFDSHLKNQNHELNYSKPEGAPDNPRSINEESKSHIHSFLAFRRGNFFIRSAIIRQARFNVGGSIFLENCCVARLEFARAEEADQSDVIGLTNCWIGELIIGGKSINNLFVRGGWICSITCPAPDEENPFKGTVYFQDVSLPIFSDFNSLFKGPQQYRNLRKHLDSLHNTPMVSLMRAKELASERQIDTGFSWLFSWLYFQISDYGLNPAKAFRIWMGLVLVTFLLLFMNDSGTAGLKPEFYNGWRKILIDDGVRGELSRSFSLVFQSMLNPLGILGPYKVVIPKTTFWKIWLTIHGVFADGAFAFFVFAIRKRFKFS